MILKRFDRYIQYILHPLLWSDEIPVINKPCLRYKNIFVVAKPKGSFQNNVVCIIRIYCRLWMKVNAEMRVGCHHKSNVQKSTATYHGKPARKEYSAYTAE